MPDECVDLVWTDPPYNVGKNYGFYKDNLSDELYLSWMTDVIKEIKRISKNICIYVPNKYALNYWNMLGPEFKQIILTYSPGGAIRYGFENQYSFLLTNVTPYKFCKNVWHNCQASNLGWFYREIKYGNPGQTSEDITARVIKYFSKKEGLICDPFMGNGTTARMAKDLKRNFIGIEINPDYCKIAEERLAQGVL